ncbi:K02A2.6-like [Cordylochernes scorpioides]|uniref:K02A2.6-like n=1 Tax=Cordylochernes scorpioides TaxID=51811 RepID=A0ABY6KQI1_9ARAC|nr:K02A2.6-like [Cordylochernes scorpioides]
MVELSELSYYRYCRITIVLLHLFLLLNLMAKLDFALILKKSLNPYLEDVKYPIPNIDSVLSNFQGKKLFTKLDLSKANNQIKMDDNSKKYLVVSTHRGLYKYNRLAFGIKTAFEIFQKTMESFFSGINDVYIYFHDILIASEDLENHLDIRKRTQDSKQAQLKLSADFEDPAQIALLNSNPTFFPCT